jgi:type I restriction enzyme S subunit
MKSISTGVTTKFLTLSLLNKTKIPVPPILTQQKIVSILSVYDDFIENNTRRIRILEEMAQAIYSEWFVNFRFPGYEGVRMVESEFGQIPEEWKILELDEIADIQWGDTSTTKSSYITDGFIAYSASGPDGFLDYYDYDRVGIVLSAIGANCGKTWYVRGKWSCIKNTIRFWAKNDNLTTEFLYFASINPDFWPRRGAAQPFISQGDAKKIKILCPEKKVVDEFSKHVICLMMMIDNLSYQNTNLRRTRDLLLPKLISGEIDVSGLDIRIPEVEA